MRAIEGTVRKAAVKQRGFTLIELLVSMAIGLLAVAAAITLYISTFQGSTALARTARLNNDMSTTLQIMTNELRRAGYWRGSIANAEPTDNPHSTDFDITIIPADECIVYSYDALDDGSPTADTTELYGFKRTTNGTVGRIEMRISTDLADFTDCDAGNWEAMSLFSSGEALNVTDLQFSFEDQAAAGGYPALAATSRCENLNNSSGAQDDTDCDDPALTADEYAVRRIVNIRMTAQSSRDGELVKIMSATVVVENDAVKVGS